MWGKTRTSSGAGGFIRYAASTCVNHLRYCSNQPTDVREQAEAESPKKQWYSPYGTIRSWPGATNFPFGPGSSQMLPPSLPPSTRFSSPALHLHTSALPSPATSALPSPAISVLPSPAISTPSSPQLSALALPSISTLPPPYATYPLWHSDQNPGLSVHHSLHVEPPTSLISQPTTLSSQRDWLKELQTKFETQIARLTASAGLPLSWVDNPEWINFIHLFLPAAKSLSRKVLTTRLIPCVAQDYRKIAKYSSRDQNATIQADGWTAANFHHLLTFMIALKKKVGFKPFYI